jgi:hypothetical protein
MTTAQWIVASAIYAFVVFIAVNTAVDIWKVKGYYRGREGDGVAGSWCLALWLVGVLVVWVLS